MIRQHGRREQLPKLLYTSPIQSTEYRKPVCITIQEWERMKFVLNKDEIVANQQNAIRADRLSMHEKSQEIMKKWRDNPENVYLLKQKNELKEEETEEELRHQLSDEIKQYHEKVTNETLAHHRLQLMLRSTKGRLLTKGILSDAATKERELQIAAQKKEKKFEKMLNESFDRVAILDQKMYVKKMNDQKQAKINENLEYYKDIDNQVAFKKELRARLDEVERLDVEQMKTLNDEYKRLEIQSRIDKKAKQRATAAAFDKQCEEKKIIKKFEQELDRYDDEVVHTYIMNKRAIKQSHADFLEEQKQLGQQKKDVVYDCILKANQKKIEEDVTELIRIKEVKKCEAMTLKKEQEAKEKFEAHKKEFIQRKENQEKVREKIKQQEIVEQIEEHKRKVEDNAEDKEREQQMQGVRREFNVNVKKCQYQHMMNNIKRKKNERICEKLQDKHVRDAYGQYDKDVDSFAQDLIDYAKENHWPTNHLNRERFTSKWCDQDHLFLGVHRMLPKVSPRRKKICTDRK